MLNNLSAAIKNLSPNLRKILSNIGWLIAERVLRMVVGFLVLAWMARYLGADNFGLLNYGIAFVAIFSTFAQLGLNHFIVRDLVSEATNKDEILGTAFFLRIISGIASLFSAIVIIFLLRPDDPSGRNIVIILTASLILQEFNVIDNWFQSQVQSKYAVWANNTAFILMTLVRITLIKTNAPLITFAWAWLAETFLSVIGLVIIYQGTGKKIQRWRPNWIRAKRLLKVSWPLILSNLSIMVYIYIDQIMLGQLADARSVGIYAAAVRLSENWPFLSLALVRSVAPSIIEAKKVSEKFYYERIQKICNLLALIFYCIAIPMTFLSTPLIILVFGQEYAPAGLILSIHIWSAIFGFLGYVKEIWVATEELTSFAFAASLLGAVINILLNLWLIPLYQGVGAAIATVISYGFADYVMCFLYPPARKFGWVMTKALTFNHLFTRLKHQS